MTLDSQLVSLPTARERLIKVVTADVFRRVAYVGRKFSESPMPDERMGKVIRFSVYQENEHVRRYHIHLVDALYARHLFFYLSTDFSSRRRG